LLNQKPPNPTTTTTTKKKPHKRTKKREIAFDSPPPPTTEKIFGNNKYKLQKTTKQNKTKTEKMYVASYFVAAAECFFSSLSLSLSLPFCFNFVMI